MAYTQAGRLMQFSSPLGQDTLLIESFEGVEGISRLFDYQVELYAAAGTDIDPTDLVGNKVTVTLNLIDGSSKRYFNGLIAAFEQTAGDSNFDVYHAHVVPSLWQLTLSTNCRVFQDKTVMDIIKAVIQPYGLSVGDVTKFAYKPLDYCTQYNETDFHFISRLAEQFGIFYWFEHTDSDNKAVFGDSRDAYSDCPNESSVQYSAQQQDQEALYHSVVSDIRVTASMVTGKHTSGNFDFRPFQRNSAGPENSTHDMGKNALERYFWPTWEAGYVKDKDKEISTPNHGALFTTAQRDASDVHANVFHGSSTVRAFLPGFTFDLTEHPRDAWNQSYLLMEVAHHTVQTPPYIADAGSARSPYSNRFVGIESTRTYRPQARTPRPRMYGPQIALVVAPNGEEQYIDKYGRINVRFMWDRTGGMNATDNTWVRVSQSWASRGFGAYFWPRMDDEVLVGFIDGDPDEPVVLGSVYNGNALPKYVLPDMQTRSGIVTRSTKGGSADNANELRFEDKKGSEQIFINAEKDIDVYVENDSRRHTLGQDSLIVDKNQLEKVGGSYNRSIGGDSIEAISGKQDLKISGQVSHEIDGTYGRTIGGDALEKISGKQGLKVTKEVAHEYEDKFSLKVGMDHGEKVGMNYALEAGMNAYIKGGMNVTIEAGMELTLKGAGGFITIGPAGVAISGTMVLINSGGAAGAGSPPQITEPDAPASPAQPADPDKADDGTKGGKM